MQQQPNSGLDGVIVEVSESQTYTTGRTPLDGGSALRRGRYLHNIQPTKETNINALSGIRTRDPSNRAAAELCLRKRGYRDRRILGFASRYSGCFNDANNKCKINEGNTSWRKMCPYLIKWRRCNNTNHMQNAVSITCKGY